MKARSGSIPRPVNCWRFRARVRRFRRIRDSRDPHRSHLCADVSGRPAQRAAANGNYGSGGFDGRQQHQSGRIQPLPSVLDHQFDPVRRRRLRACAAAAAWAALRHGQQPIPSGFSLLMRFSTPVTAQSAVGERCALVMMADVGTNGEKIIEKGAKVEGRIRWIEQSSCPAQCLAVAVELVSVMTTDGTQHPVYAGLRQVVPEAKVSLKCLQGFANADRIAFWRAANGNLVPVDRDPRDSWSGQLFCAHSRSDDAAGLSDDLVN